MRVMEGNGTRDMNRYMTACLAFAASTLAGNAWSAETSGRITYLSADRKELMLDNSRMYTFANSSEALKAAVGDRVELKLGGTDGKQVTEITKIS